jgi:nicotinamidase-related amidase
MHPGHISPQNERPKPLLANTDLDHQLEEHGIEKIIIFGMLANTCIEWTGRFGMELGYHVTLVKDATAAFSREAMHAAHEINGPTRAL